MINTGLVTSHRFQSHVHVSSFSTNSQNGLTPILQQTILPTFYKATFSRSWVKESKNLYLPRLWIISGHIIHFSTIGAWRKSSTKAGTSFSANRTFWMPTGATADPGVTDWEASWLEVAEAALGCLSFLSLPWFAEINTSTQLIRGHGKT